jgi:peptidoglycan biosynthesis protein MviN/MurJ (putative lipid II flippase)
MALDPAGERLATVTSRMVRFAIVGFIPITILTIAVAPVAVTVAYGRGAFTDGDLALTTGVAAGFAPLIVVLMTSPVMRLALNARRLGRIILFGAVLNVLLNAVFDVLFGIALGVVGVALSSGLTAAAVAVFFAQRLARSDPGFHLRPIARSLTASVVASLPGALLVGAFTWSGTYPRETLPALAVLAAFGVVGMLSFIAIGWLTRIEEVRQLVQVGTRRLRRADRGVGP